LSELKDRIQPALDQRMHGPARGTPRQGVFDPIEDLRAAGLFLEPVVVNPQLVRLAQLLVDEFSRRIPVAYQT
jgi:hypothetical protein